MLGEQFAFVEKLRDNGLEYWNDITREFNEKFNDGVTPEALRNRYRREKSARETLTGDIVEKAFKIIKREPIKPTELARRLGLDIDGLEVVLDDLMKSQAAVKFHQNHLVFDSFTFPDNNFFSLSPEETGIVTEKWGVFSDPHFCSIYERPDLVHQFYKKCAEEEVKGVLCAGDLTAGNGTVFKGQYQELKIFGVDKQTDYICSIWPDTELMTYTISGNHDLDVFKTSGIDIVQNICDRLDNVTYLGKIGATLITNGISIYLHHGDGGLGSIRSYKPQKLIDAMEDLPNIAIFGHWHVTDHMPKYRGVISICPGCFESKSEYLTKKGLNPDIGGVILELTIATVNGCRKVIEHSFKFIDYTGM